MTVLSAGLIANGESLFVVDYQQKIQGNSQFRSGLFSALQSFAHEAFGDETEELRLEKFIVCFNAFKIQKQDIIAYAVLDRKTRSTKATHNGLEAIREAIISQKYLINLTDHSQNTTLQQLFDAEIHRDTERFDQRLKRIRKKI